ncbi:phosphoribosyl-AMP cyclohydrolase [Marinospirillum perlucidum]|uniref:phosphoribosyl-AMP cyclohydrolase n=1 Tax=Marinospirillum perlucidum TaxID=1982602 RepID=UPI000DF13593|nr:phosphoribosyl-AMP cyclohydrolase [Marinospirillum perlucidum]
MASSNSFWKELEKAPRGTHESLKATLDQLAFNDQGLIAAIAQQEDSGEVLMQAWMNRESLEITLKEGRACYWSRSRGKLWRKGESSGQVQLLKAVRVDCDGDALLLLVDQQGPACHTGRRSCFYMDLKPEGLEVIKDVDVDPASLYG